MTDAAATPDLPLRLLPGDRERHRLPVRVIRYWQLQNLLLWLGGLAVVITVSIIWPTLPNWIVLVLFGAVAIAGAVAVLDPPFRYRRLWYAISDAEIDIQQGLVVIERTVVPMNRVQHLRMEHGFIADRFQIANLHIHTGAGTVSLAGLDRADAENIRVRISTLAHLSDDL